METIYDHWTLDVATPVTIYPVISSQHTWSGIIHTRGFITAPEHFTLSVKIDISRVFIPQQYCPKDMFQSFRARYFRLCQKDFQWSFLASQSFCHCYLHRNILWASVLCGYICVCEMCNFIITLTEKCKLCYSMEVNSSSWAPHLYILILTLLCSFSHLPPGPGARSPYNASPGRSKTGEMFIFILFPFDSYFPA